MSIINDNEDKPEFNIIARVILTVPADSLEDAKRIAKDTLDEVDYWPTVDIEDAYPFIG